MGNKYDWGIYNGVGGEYNFKDKSVNVRNKVAGMLIKSMRMFEYENLPETIPPHELEKLIQSNGFACIVEVDSKLYAVNGGLGGERGVYNEPTEIVVSNSALNLNKTLKIGVDCVIIKNDYLGLGMFPLYNQYASMLSENEITMILSNVNKRVDNLISVSDDNTGESAKTYLKKIFEGELGYIFENKLFESLKSNPTSNGNSVRMMDLVEYQQYLKSNLLNEIGLNSNHSMKKERMISAEVTIDAESIYALIDSMLDSRVSGVDEINKLFNTNISVMFGGSWKHRNEVAHPEIIEPEELYPIIEEIEIEEPEPVIEEPEPVIEEPEPVIEEPEIEDDAEVTE